MIENIGAYSQVDYNRGYQQGRADAIDECKQKLEECWLNGTVANRIVKELQDSLEQLKEQSK